MLSMVPFTITATGDSSNYTALTWFTDKPCAEDELYKVVVVVNDNVKEAIKEIEEHQA